MHKINFHRRTFLHNIRSQPDVIKAIIQNDEHRVQQIITNSNSDDWVVTDQNRRTPLHLAASLGHTKILRILIETDCFTVNCRDNILVTPLHRACRNNHLDCVRLLIEYKADVNARTRNHLTPLHICAWMGNYDCAQMIIEHVANIDATDSFGATALHHAVYNSHLNIIQLLLQHGAKADVQDKFGRRPIHYAAMTNDPTIIRTLVEQANADVNARNKYLLTPTHFAVAFENLDSFNELLSFNANLDAKDIHGNNIAHWAAYIGCRAIFEKVAAKMKMNAPNLNGVTPLHFACLSRSSLSWYVVKDLIQQSKNQDLDIVDKFNRTSLHYAAMNGQTMVVSLLLDHGSDCNACDSDLEAPIHKAVQNVHLNVINELIKYKVDINMANKDGFTPLHYAAMTSNAQFCKVLIDAGCDPRHWDSCGRTAHFMAVYMGSLECFYELLASPIYVNMIENYSASNNKILIFPEIDGLKRSLLHYAAASKCSEEFIQFLLLQTHLKRFDSLDPRVLQALKIAFSRFDLNQQDIYGRTPLHYLCRRTNEIEVDITSMVRLLIDCGADNSIMDHNNRFAFHYAVANGYTYTLTYLIDRKWFQNPNTYQKMFYWVCCPLKIAAFHGNLSSLSVLLNYGFSDYDSAFEIAIRRYHWECAHRLITLIRKSLLWKMALFTATYGLVDGLRLFLDLPVRALEYLMFVAAASKNGTLCLEMLLNKEVNIHLRDRNGRNALFYAVAGGNRSSILLLMQSGIRIVNDNLDRNVFHLIAERGDLETFSLLCNVSKTCGYEFICNFLLSKDKEGFCPVEIACINHNQNILEYYINNINRGYAEKLMFFSGITANLKFVEYFLNRYSYTLLHSRGPHQRTILHYCCMSMANNLSLLKLLIHLNFDVNLPDDKGLTPLLCAAYVGNVHTINYLLEHTQANANLIDHDGNTILHLACLSRSKKTAMAIINYAKDHNQLDQLLIAKNNSKQTALHLAAKMKMPSVILEMLRCGASVNDDDEFGYVPSLYCTDDALSAYCLFIIEAFMLPEPQPSSAQSSNSDLINNHSILTDNNNDQSDGDSTTDSKKIIKNGRLSLPASFDERLEQRMRRMSSLICDKLSRMSLSKQTSTTSKRDSLDINTSLNNFNDNSTIIDSDSDLF